MDQKEKRTIIIVIAIFAIIIIGLIIWRANSGKPEEKKNTVDTPMTNEKYVDMQSDGTKVNKSSKLQETKKLGNLEISNVRLTSKNNESYIQATVKNTGSAKAGDDFITLTILDDQGKTLTKVDCYLDSMESGKESTLSVKTSADFANAYDFTVSK